MPNYFQFLGPNCPIGNGPLLIAIEAQADYILALCDKWQTENVKSFTPKDQAVTEFLSYCDQYLKNTVWDEECRSWYKNNSASGRVALWPGSTMHYLETLREPRFEDWDVSTNSAYADSRIERLLTVALSSSFPMEIVFHTWVMDSQKLR